MLRVTIVFVFLLLNVSLIHSNAPFLDDNDVQRNHSDSSSEPIPALDPYIQSTDPYIQSTDPCIQSSDSYIQSSDSYIQSRDPYIQSRDPYIQSSDSYIQTEQRDYITGYSCYWMENNRQGAWILSSWGFKGCKQRDSCNGGDGRPGGRCYKWALSPTSPRVPWDIELNSNILILTNHEQGRVDELNARYRIELRQILGSDARVEQYMIEYR